MKEFTYTVKDPAGLHARPAGLLVKAMQSFECNINITCNGKTVSCKKLFALMGLAVKSGETITITADGFDEVEAIDRAKVLFKEEYL